MTTNTRRVYNPIQKDYVTFLKTSEETAGKFSLVEVELAPVAETTCIIIWNS
jgi:hypothetical protein